LSPSAGTRSRPSFLRYSCTEPIEHPARRAASRSVADGFAR
jgi:hypothetical protein